MAKPPYPQFDYPGSKKSPWTGKPYTDAEKAKIHAAVSLRNKQKVRGSAGRLSAAERRLMKARELSQSNKPKRESRLPIGLKDWKKKSLPDIGFGSQKAMDERRRRKGSLSDQFKESRVRAAIVPDNKRPKKSSGWAAIEADRAAAKPRRSAKKKPSFNAAVERKRIKYAQSRQA